MWGSWLRCHLALCNPFARPCTPPPKLPTLHTPFVCRQYTPLGCDEMAWDKVHPGRDVVYICVPPSTAHFGNPLFHCNCGVGWDVTLDILPEILLITFWFQLLALKGHRTIVKFLTNETPLHCRHNTFLIFSCSNFRDLLQALLNTILNPFEFGVPKQDQNCAAGLIVIVSNVSKGNKSFGKEQTKNRT